MVVYLGIATSSSVDLLLATGEVAVIAALAITILVKTGPAHYSCAVFSQRHRRTASSATSPMR